MIYITVLAQESKDNFPKTFGVLESNSFMLIWTVHLLFIFHHKLYLCRYVHIEAVLTDVLIQNLD